jgi:hypothetical protein
MRKLIRCCRMIVLTLHIITMAAVPAAAEPGDTRATCVLDGSGSLDVNIPVNIDGTCIVGAGARGANTITVGSGVAGTSGGTSGSGTGIRYIPYTRLTTGPDGQPCVTTGYAREGVTPTDDLSSAAGAHPGGGGFNAYFDFSPCSQHPRAPGSPTPAETRAMVAARHWEGPVSPPRPRPYIAPGRALTGKPAYLETGNRTSFTYQADTEFGPLTINASGSYTVVWGDGTTTGPFSFEGISWPTGRITHEYQDVGTYNVVVIERWTATWSLDGESGVLRALQSTGTLNNFPVEQLQAVITR